jgi:hypothetical protein
MICAEGKEERTSGRVILLGLCTTFREAGEFQSSLRDFSSLNLYPGLRPGLSSAVPPGLILQSLVLTQTLKPVSTFPYLEH